MRGIMKKELFCERCHNCMMDCKKKFDESKCENYKKGYNRFEYMKMIKEQNLNKRKFCNEYNLKLTYLNKMLEGKIELKYKYRIALNNRLFEKTEYLPYLER